MPNEVRNVLLITKLVTGYGKKRVVNGASLSVSRGEVVALIGHNGAGKSTLLKAIFGMLPIWEGNIFLNDKGPIRPNPRELLLQHVAYVPQGNRVFGDLIVRENLEVAGAILGNKRRVEERTEVVLGLFPILKTNLYKRAGVLSGGEKQMLALANALIVAPRVLLLDEPSLGLAPPLVTEFLRRIRDIARENGASILIVEQKVREVLKVADRVYVLRNGEVSYSGSAESLNDERKLSEVYL